MIDVQTPLVEDKFRVAVFAFESTAAQAARLDKLHYSLAERPYNFVVAHFSRP
jgi:hypothetical protein